MSLQYVFCRCCARRYTISRIESRMLIYYESRMWIHCESPYLDQHQIFFLEILQMYSLPFFFLLYFTAFFFSFCFLSFESVSSYAFALQNFSWKLFHRHNINIRLLSSMFTQMSHVASFMLEQLCTVKTLKKPP